jgi:hypothetical protein
MKRIFGKKVFNNFCKSNFSTVEDEIRRSFMNISQQYKIDTSSFKPPVVYEYISFKEIEKKYLKKPENEIDEIISKIYKEEVLNMKVGKELDDLILFIRNCKKYDYPQYLTHIKYFKTEKPEK